MRERPILFTDPMVRAVLTDQKTQTRRALKRQPPADTEWFSTWHHPKDSSGLHYWAGRGGELLDFALCCPYGNPGDRLWVREAFDPIYPQDPHYNSGRAIEFDYRATYQHGFRLGDHIGIKKTWKPGIHMPREGSRIALEVTRVRIERLQAISEADAVAEGVASIIVSDGGESRYVDYAEPDSKCSAFGTARRSYRSLWEQINGKGTWAANPWVWIVEFKRHPRPPGPVPL